MPKSAIVTDDATRQRTVNETVRGGVTTVTSTILVVTARRRRTGAKVRVAVIMRGADQGPNARANRGSLPAIVRERSAIVADDSPGDATEQRAVNGTWPENLGVRRTQGESGKTERKESFHGGGE